MENNNNIRITLALFLSILVIYLFSGGDKIQQGAFPTQNIETPAQSQQQAADNSFQAPVQPKTQDEIEAEQQSEANESIQKISESPKVTIKTRYVEAEFSRLGGRLISYKLRQHFTDVKQTQEINLIDKDSRIFPLGVYLGQVNDEKTEYDFDIDTTPTDNNIYTVSGNEGSLTLTLHGKLSNGVGITKTITLSNLDYYFTVNVELDEPVSNSNIWLEWTNYISDKAEKQNWNLKNYTLFLLDEKIEQVQLEKLTSDFITYGTNWAAFGDNYFVNAIIPTFKGQNTMLAAQVVKDVGSVYFQRLAGDKTKASFSLYAGPKRVEDMSKKGYRLEKTIDLGIFAVIGQPILIVLELFYELLGNYGLAIILLTLCIKMLLFPLTNKSLKSMQAMQDLKPEMDALKARIKDQGELQQAIMALYKRKGINPMGGCLPMLIQIPVFLGMYNALRVSFNLRHQPFALWINDLSAPEALPLFGYNIPVMILIMGLSMFIQQLTTPSSANMDPAQRKAMLITPIIFTGMFLIWPFPSGLVLYWLVNNLTSIAQQIALSASKKKNSPKSSISPLLIMVVSDIIIFGLGFMLTLL